MPQPFKLAVISDQHIDSVADARSWDLARAAYDAVARARVDHLVLCGDTFDCSTAMRRDRALVEKHLRRLGLWHRDRLTIVVGNHDVFHTPHRGDRAHRAAEYARVLTHDAPRMYEEFCAWAAGVTRTDDRLGGTDPFPQAKVLGFVRLVAADTTAPATSVSGNGHWPRHQDLLLRDAMTRAAERRVLAVHNAPFVGSENTIPRLLSGSIRNGAPAFSLGYPERHYARLVGFVNDVEIDAVVCGHLHDPGDDRYEWEIGRSCPVYLMGRTGGVHDTEPCIGVASVPEVGPVRWRVLGVRDEERQRGAGCSA